MGSVHNLQPSHPPKLRVLIVEDNLDAVHSMAALIRMMGHEVEFAINGFAALDIARRFRPQVILLDIGLPDFKGYNIARQLKWEPDLAKTRIIAITGRSMDEVRQKALDAGCVNVFAKPMDPAVLEEVLAER
jgi:two-component system CheB/CheR fusion protein